MSALGGADNPEQWPAEVWAEDVALMRTVGIGLVAINILGWSDLLSARLDPHGGRTRRRPAFGATG